MTKYIRNLLLALIAIGGFSSSFFVRAEILEAQWEVHQVRFRFIGLSTAYTCDSIEGSLKRLLKLLGARDDVRAESSCTNYNNVQRFHRVRLAFAMPVPADKTDISRKIIPAEWQEVRIIGRSSRYLDPGECELLEQFERQVLPLLQAHNLKKKIRCATYHRRFNTMRLRLMALKTLEKTELEEGRNEVLNDNPQPDK